MKYIKGINEGFEDEFNSKWFNHLFIKNKDKYSELYIIRHSENGETDESDDGVSTWFEFIGKKDDLWYLLTQDFDIQDTYDSYEEIETIHGTPPMSILKSFDVKKFKTFKEIGKLFNIEKKEIEDNFVDYFADLIDNGFNLVSQEVLFLNRYNEIVERGNLKSEQIIKLVFKLTDENKIFSRKNGKLHFYNDINLYDKVYPVLKKVNKVLNASGKKLYYSTSNYLIIIVKNI